MDVYQKIVKDNQHLFGDIFKSKFDDDHSEYVYIGILTGVDDYYHAFSRVEDQSLHLLTAVSPIDWAYEKVKDKFDALVGMSFQEAKSYIQYFQYEYNVCKFEEDYKSGFVNIVVEDEKVLKWITK